MTGTTSFDPEAPLERMAGESLRANAALRDYTFMGLGRSLRKLLGNYKGMQGRHKEDTANPAPPTVRLTRLQTWSTRFHWQDRVGAYERLITRQEEERWLERRQQLRGQEWEMHDRLFRLANEIVDAAPDFIAEKEIELPGGSKVIYKKLDAWLAIKASETGSDLGRRSAGMEKETTKLEHTGSLAAPVSDYASLEDGQLDQLIYNLLAAGTEGEAGGSAPGEEPAEGGESTA